MSFSGKVALVVGGSRGIGRAICLRLSQEGAHVIVNFSRRTEDAEKTVSLVQQAGGTAQAIRADIADAEQVRAMFHQIQQEHGRLDFLINNAARGMDRPRDALKALPQHLRRTFDVNLLGPWLCAQEAAKLMESGGRIVNISSVGARRYSPRYAAVGVSKAALEALTFYLAVELAPRGIAVNAVAGGLVEGTEGAKWFPAELKQQMASQTPAGRLVTAQDMANVVAFLCSDDAAMICGQTIVVDGGFTLLAMPQ